MRYIITFLFAVAANSVWAQVSFEGKIVYKINAANEKDEGQLTIYYGKMHLRVDFSEKNNAVTDYTLIDLDSGKVMLVTNQTKTYQITRLSRRTSLGVIDSNKVISGYKTTLLKSPAYSSMSRFSRLIPNSTFYIANDLYYSVPNEFADNEQLLMVQNGRIVLGVEINFPDPYFNDDADSIQAITRKDENIRINAININRETLDPSVFAIPSDYKRFSYNFNSSKLSVDSVDSVYKKLPLQKSEKQLPKPINKNNNTNKSPLQRKQE